jgi:hypothetical protein
MIPITLKGHYKLGNQIVQVTDLHPKQDRVQVAPTTLTVLIGSGTPVGIRHPDEMVVPPEDLQPLRGPATWTVHYRSARNMAKRGEQIVDVPPSTLAEAARLWADYISSIEIEETEARRANGSA